jgi:hypothetical protein
VVGHEGAPRHAPRGSLWITVAVSICWLSILSASDDRGVGVPSVIPYGPRLLPSYADGWTLVSTRPARGSLPWWTLLLNWTWLRRPSRKP